MDARISNAVGSTATRLDPTYQTRAAGIAPTLRQHRPALLQRRKQLGHVGFVEAQALAGAAFEHGAGKVGFSPLQYLDFFFSGAGADTLVHKTRFLLDDSVGTEKTRGRKEGVRQLNR